MYFQYYKLWKPLLENSLKSTVSEHALTVNMWKRPKYLPNFHESVFVMFCIILSKVDLENLWCSVRWNLSSVFEDIDIRWQVSCSRLWRFEIPISNSVIWKIKKIFWFFFSISGIYIKFQIFWRKSWLS